MRLTIDNATYVYHNSKSPAVNEVCCVFELGKVYAIAGPSGSGKSTLLSIMAGLDAPSGGDIWYGNANLKELDLDNYRRVSVSMIFQAFQLFSFMTAVENVCYPMELGGVNPKEAKLKAERLLLRVGITQDKFGRFPSHLSGGEQQRVAIARSLASGAKFILADEPTGNLDVDNSVKIMNILSNLAHEHGYCVIVVTHDNDIAKTADIVYRMTDGRVAICKG